MERLTDDHIKEVARKNGVEFALIKAVDMVESKGSGSGEDGKIKILFEGHVFYNKLKLMGKDVAKLSAQYPSIIYPKWDRRKYSRTNAGEHQRLDLAISIHPAAKECASYGRFQIMGFNYHDSGYPTVDAMIEAFEASEVKHLEGMLTLCKNENWLIHLLNKDWAKFAFHYNGKGYAANKYDIRLKEEYEKAKKL